MSWFDSFESGGYDSLNQEGGGILANSYDSSGTLDPTPTPGNQTGISYQQEYDMIASQGNGVNLANGTTAASPFWAELGSGIVKVSSAIASTGAAAATAITAVKNAGAQINSAANTPGVIPQQTRNNLGYYPNAAQPMSDAVKLALLGLAVSIMLKW